MESAGKPVSQRSAAKKASKLAAQQLESSDDESAPDASAAHARTARPKRSTKAIHPAPSLPNISTKLKSSSLGLSMPPPSQPRRRNSVSQEGKGKGKQAALASASSSKPTTLLPLSDSDSDTEIFGPFRRTGPQPSSSSRLNDSRNGSATKDSAMSTSMLPSLKTPTAKKRILSIQEMSPIGSLSSLSPSPETQRHLPVPAQQLSPGSPAIEDWNLHRLGRLVWVRVDLSGRISDTRANSVWWPAEVSNGQTAAVTG